MLEIWKNWLIIIHTSWEKISFRLSIEIKLKLVLEITKKKALSECGKPYLFSSIKSQYNILLCTPKVIIIIIIILS